MDEETADRSNRQGHDRVAEMTELLECVRHNAVRLLGDVASVPHNLRVQAGAVSIEVEWPEDGNHAGTVTQIPAGDPVPEPDTAESGNYVTAPTVGVFYRATEPGAEPFVREGDRIRSGQQVGIIEAMKLMIPVEAECAGQVTKVLKENGQAVEYGEPLFATTPEGR